MKYLTWLVSSWMDRSRKSCILRKQGPVLLANHPLNKREGCFNWVEKVQASIMSNSPRYQQQLTANRSKFGHRAQWSVCKLYISPSSLIMTLWYWGCMLWWTQHSWEQQHLKWTWNITKCLTRVLTTMCMRAVKMLTCLLYANKFIVLFWLNSST